jgi:hypothetical protein
MAGLLCEKKRSATEKHRDHRGKDEKIEILVSLYVLFLIFGALFATLAASTWLNEDYEGKGRACIVFSFYRIEEKYVPQTAAMPLSGHDDECGVYYNPKSLPAIFAADT